METDASTSQPPSKRPRPILLVLLGALVAVFLWMQLGGSTVQTPSPSNSPRASQPSSAQASVEPAALDVHLESLEGERPIPGEAERNPFRFKPKPEPPAPKSPPTAFKPPDDVESGPAKPIGPPAPPPITIKFLGTLELPDGTTRAMFTECTVGRKTQHVKEGEAILGQYRLVKIGLQSVVVEHLDGRGRTTLAKTGQECVWK
jgi:hypothetical protein